MHHRYLHSLPERMVALSVLPPPSPGEAPHPFGFGAFVVTPRDRTEAAFALHVHGYGARYDPARIRRDIKALFTPETKALIYAPGAPFADGSQEPRLALPEGLVELVPRIGLRTNVLIQAPYDVLAHAAKIGGVRAPQLAPSPLQRIPRLGDEAQAAWVYWLFKRCSPKLRRNVLASHAAWRVIERAKSRLTRIRP